MSATPMNLKPSFSEINRVSRAAFEAADWLRAIIEDAEAGEHQFDAGVLASLKACVTEIDSAVTAIGYEHNHGN